MGEKQVEAIVSRRLSLAARTFPSQNRDSGWTKEGHISNQQIRNHGNS
jgi:hypothetical protein